MANQLVGWQRHCPLIETTIWAKRVGRLTHFSKNPTNQYPRQGLNKRSITAGKQGGEHKATSNPTSVLQVGPKQHLQATPTPLPTSPRVSPPCHPKSLPP